MEKGRERYRTKDIWVAVCLLALNERMVKVDYDSFTNKVFFEFDVPPAKGKALEAVFASNDSRLVLPVVTLQRAYENLHKWRYLVFQLRRSLELEEVQQHFDELFSTMATQKVPQNLDEVIELLQSEGKEHETGSP